MSPKKKGYLSWSGIGVVIIKSGGTVREQTCKDDESSD